MHKDAYAPVVAQSKQTNNYTNPKFVNIELEWLEIIKKIWMLYNLDYKLYLHNV